MQQRKYQLKQIGTVEFWVNKMHFRWWQEGTDFCLVWVSIWLPILNLSTFSYLGVCILMQPQYFSLHWHTQITGQFKDKSFNLILHFRTFFYIIKYGIFTVEEQIFYTHYLFPKKVLSWPRTPELQTAAAFLTKVFIHCHRINCEHNSIFLSFSAKVTRLLVSRPQSKTQDKTGNVAKFWCVLSSQH